MSPAGHWEQLRAAVEAGADAVYFGLQHFTARAKVGFTREELPEVFRTLHGRGVRGFVTFNTLVFEHELEEAARGITAIAEAGADAIIVQDVGVLELVREIAPDLEIHASTQMSITDARGARLAAAMGAHRVTLARELSLKEIEAIAAETDIELECFVHGALCVAYSGQCFSSEAWGGRSANRGQCAQACRLPYELFVDDRRNPLGDARYLLSPGDLYALHQVPELTRIGVATLKIEGRYKDAEYVAATTRAYRKAVDEAWAERAWSVTEREELELEQVYSRGLGAFFLTGTDHQKVVRGRAPRHRGVWMGTVKRVEEDAVVIEAAGRAQELSPLKPGDGVVFDASEWRSPDEREEGGRIYAVEPVRGGGLRLQFGNREIRYERIRVGDWLWRTQDPALERVLKPYTQATMPVQRQRVDVRVRAAVGERLESWWRVKDIEVAVRSEQVLGAAQNRALDAELLRAQFQRLGGTAYELGELRLEAAAAVFAPASMLNQMRREAVEALEKKQTAPREREIRAVDWTKRRVVAEAGSAGTRVHLLVRTPEQLEAALELRPDTVTLDYLDLYGLKPSVEHVKQVGIGVRVATPRILKPGEERIADFLLRLDTDLLVRPAGLLSELRERTGRELTGDFSLNAANTLSARALLELGLKRITPTHDLNGEQVAELARGIGGARMEAIVYQHLPVFHTEHCVFCRFLSEGTSFKDCGRPCEKHKVELEDPQGRRHPLLADIGCRNTVFGAEAQEASSFLEAWRVAGIGDFRLEFAHENGDQVRRAVRAFRQALEGAIDTRALGEKWREIAPQGSTLGSLFVPLEHLTLTVLR